MRRTFTGLAALLLLAVVAQFFLAASGAFDTAPNDESFRTHRTLGAGIVLFAVLATAAAATARMPGRLIGLCGLVAGLVIVQFVIRVAASALDDIGGSAIAAELVFGLHAINGLAILGVAGTIVRQAVQLSRPAPPTRRGRQSTVVGRLRRSGR